MRSGTPIPCPVTSGDWEAPARRARGAGGTRGGSSAGEGGGATFCCSSASRFCCTMMTRYSSHCFWNSATFFLASSSSKDITSTFSLVSSILNNPVRSLLAWSSSSCRFSASKLGDRVGSGPQEPGRPERRGSFRLFLPRAALVPVFLPVATDTILVGFLSFPAWIIANSLPTSLSASRLSCL